MLKKQIKQIKVKTPDINAFSISVQGASHIKNNKVCQDYSFYDSYGKKYIAIVCDGHVGR